MLLKHHLNYKAFMHALIEFRATPRLDSYLQVFYGRRMKTDVHAHHGLDPENQNRLVSSRVSKTEGLG
jgi:hypothetical protein